MYEELNKLFTLRVPGQFKGDPMIVIHAYDANRFDGSHNRIDCELRQGGKVIFARGTTWCRLPQHECIDSVVAKELVLSLFSMRPGDTDSEYFASYSDEQLAWAVRNGEWLSIIREERYCDS